jgi:hypothetical protein
LYDIDIYIIKILNVWVIEYEQQIAMRTVIILILLLLIIIIIIIIIITVIITIRITVVNGRLDFKIF